MALTREKLHALDGAAKAFECLDYIDFVETHQMSPTEKQFIIRAMEIYAASALSSVREKLPTKQQLKGMFAYASPSDEDRELYYGQVRAAELIVNQVKELLK